MRGGRGFRLVVSGPRAHPVTVELSAPNGFLFVTTPTLRGGEGVQRDGERTRVTFPAGDEPHVALFMPRLADDEVTVTAREGGKPVAAGRFHLGPGGATPDSAPVKMVLTEMKERLLSDAPPAPEKPREWGIWIWAPSTAMPRPGESALPSAVSLPQELGRQLKALGYVD